MNNLYLKEFELVHMNTRPYEAFKHRLTMVKRFSWAVPNEEAIEAIHKLRTPVVEVGAGGGYWAYCMRQLGIDVVAYDKQPYNNHYCSSQWSEVLEGDERSVRGHADRALLLVWPPYDTSMAFDTLSTFKGNLLIYVGEGYGGCTGDDAFHEKLEEEWDLSEEVEIPQWAGINDSLQILCRKNLIN